MSPDLNYKTTPERFTLWDFLIETGSIIALSAFLATICVWFIILS